MDKLSVRNLITILQSYDPDSEVRLAFQKSWPFEYSIGTIAEVTVEDEEFEDSIVYIGEGIQIGYLPKEATEALDW